MCAACCCPPPPELDRKACCSERKPQREEQVAVASPYVWALMSGPLVVVIASLVTAWIAWSWADRVLPTYDMNPTTAPASIKTLRTPDAINTEEKRP